jgi:hypothetical protein
MVRSPNDEFPMTNRKPRHPVPARHGGGIEGHGTVVTLIVTSARAGDDGSGGGGFGHPVSAQPGGGPFIDLKQ